MRILNRALEEPLMPRGWHSTAQRLSRLSFPERRPGPPKMLCVDGDGAGGVHDSCSLGQVEEAGPRYRMKPCLGRLAIIAVVPGGGAEIFC